MRRIIPISRTRDALIDSIIVNLERYVNPKSSHEAYFRGYADRGSLRRGYVPAVRASAAKEIKNDLAVLLA